ncbi:hypothetical protein [Parasedimentitalea psychrophila]|uniref:Uncharacterized protein n=1 Tax=Parasedimentitalea psychrophila TaxID=2997337 RepID=A0A9Y2KY97_9RHOB|nr:hypothetical protein [Parasedimentitalea psychrophila]WIY24246.1 hypothetical protein QPJ95_16810 [Parasedimentitalea psychrophila]
MVKTITRHLLEPLWRGQVKLKKIAKLIEMTTATIRRRSNRFGLPKRNNQGRLLVEVNKATAPERQPLPPHPNWTAKQDDELFSMGRNWQHWHSSAQSHGKIITPAVTGSVPVAPLTKAHLL